MCWSGEASLTLASVGLIGAALAARSGHSRGRWLPLVYFAGMEMLQGITYSVIGRCDSDVNRVLTSLSYVHICFQPYFVNMFSLTFATKQQRIRAARWIWTVCGLAAVTMLMMKALPMWPAPCNIAEQNMCGPLTCSYHGEWHIAWMVNLSNLDPHYLSYMFAAFAAPIIYGAWRITLYHIIVGPALAMLLTTNKDEMPAIWCLLSIGLLLATHIPWLNHLLGGDKNC